MTHESASSRPTVPEGSNVRVGGYRLGLRFIDLTNKIARLVEIFAEAVSLGFLRSDDVERIVFESYAGEPEFYDPEHYHPPFEGEELALSAELRTHAPGLRLLDAFCGQGREARTLAKQGFDVTGIDRLPVMVERAAEYAAREGFRARFLVADFESFSDELGYDVVYTSAWMYSTFQGRARRVRFLRHCRSLCSPDGLIAISYRARSLAQRFQYRVRHAVARCTALLTFGNRELQLGDRLYFGLFWHHFDEDDLVSELEEAGLETVNRRDLKDGQLVSRVLRRARLSPGS